jgi:hypothetical protein
MKHRANVVAGPLQDFVSWAVLFLTVGQLAAFDAPPQPAAGPDPFQSRPPGPPQGQIDRLVFGQLEKLGIPLANLCSDGVFIRRVYLDVIGTLPTGLEARTFLLDPSLDKRRSLIDHLLERDEFADYWAMEWSDLLRVKAEFPINLWPNAAQAYHRWIRTQIKENEPCDRFVRELLTASGSNFRDPPVNFYRAMQNREPAGMAQTVALTFMGTRAERWPAPRLAGMAAFFSQVGFKSTGEWKEEIVFWDPGRATNDLAKGAVFPDGTPARLTGDRDPRAVFADWLIDPKNPWFTRNFANRLWSWLLGRGIVQEPDDFRPDNPPANAELLAYLEQQLIAAHYDLKALFRLILNSQTYQLSCVPRSTQPMAAANFAAYPLRRLEAEVLVDAVNQVTGGTEKYTSSIPEPFTFIPDTERSIALPDGSITGAFLEMFGRSPRDTGLESERNSRLTAEQRLHLLNSSHTLRKLEQSRMIQFQTQAGRTPQDIATGMYLGILSRFPARAELETAGAYFQSGGRDRRSSAVDLAWALLNSDEFIFRH